MLVLSRKSEETTCLLELGIELKILQLRGQNVSVGIEAPRKVWILREDLLATDDVESSSWFRNPAIRHTA